MSVLRFENVSKQYAGGHQALVDVSFQVDAGEMLFVTGHSGAGKSTLLKLIHLDERPSRGAVVFDERNLLKVRGDSMVDAGILSGDVAVVETSMQVVHGDVVVAEIDGSHTIKEYRTDRGKPYLTAHSGDRPSMSAKETLNIIGVVRGIVRSYKPSQTGQTKVAKQGALR